MSAAVVIARRRKRLVRRFREAGALDWERATTVEALGERHTWVFDQMVRRGVFHPVEGGRYFMDEKAAIEFLHRRRVRALRMGAIFLTLFLLVWLLRLLLR